MNALKARRTSCRLSQVELAVRAGIQPGLVCRYERGIQPGQRNALRLAEALDCNVEDMFPGFRNLRPY
jgi:transcriptional regulator with XRE-family HTH domain